MSIFGFFFSSAISFLGDVFRPNVSGAEC
jgi:hypothetical protein